MSDYRIDKDLWIEWLSMRETQASLVQGPKDQVFVVLRKSFFDQLIRLKAKADKNNCPDCGRPLFVASGHGPEPCGRKS